MASIISHATAIIEALLAERYPGEWPNDKIFDKGPPAGEPST